MRIAVFVLSVIVANAVTIGGILAVVLLSPGRAAALVWLPIIALTAFVYGPLVLGSLASYWDLRATPESRRYFGRYFAVVYGVQAVGAVAIIAFAILAPAPVWLPAAFLVTAAVLNVIALPVGRALYRRDAARQTVDPPWQPVTRQQIARKVLLVAVTFGAVLVIGAVVLTILSAAFGRHREPLWVPLLFAAQFAFLGAAIACIIVTLQLNRQLREHVGRDIGLLRRISRVVLRKRPEILGADEQAAAAKYAAIVSLTLPFTLAYVLLLYLGIGMQQLEQVLVGRPSAVGIPLLAIAVFVVVGLGPLYVVRIRRARRYAADHRDLLPASA